MVNNEDMETQRVESLWTHLYWLTILAQQGSYTRAATRLGVSKAAMSQRIAELERAAGGSPVQRTTRSARRVARHRPGGVRAAAARAASVGLSSGKSGSARAARGVGPDQFARKRGF